MASSQFIRFSGISLCLSGAIYLLDTALDAVGSGANIGALVPVFGLIGFPALWRALRQPENPLAIASYGLSMAGLAGLVMVTFTVNRVLPNLGGDQIPALLSGLRPEFLTIGVIFMLSAWLLCAVSRTADRWFFRGAILYALGSIPVALPPLMPPAVVTTGGIAIALALLIWGGRLLSEPQRFASDAVQ